MALNQELNAAINLARRAGEIQLASLEKCGSIEIKQDLSPVTIVDRRCEMLIQEELARSFPHDGFIGEESGEKPGTSGRTWIVDPLDGTRPYIRGIPTFSVLIALLENNVPVAGVIHLPAMNSMCWATKGKGAFLNNTAIHVAATSSPDKAIGSALGYVQKADTKEGKQLLSLMRSWDYAYGFMDAYSYVCVASGKLDCTVNLLDKPWDCASAACIVTEAGGVFSAINGEATIFNGSIILSNQALHQHILKFFAC